MKNFVRASSLLLPIFFALLFFRADAATSALVKASGPSIFYQKGSFLYVFPSEHVFYSWFDDFSGVREITDAALSRFQLKGVVFYRPGLLVKTPTSPVVYVVEPGGVLRPIVNETIARQLYGTDWWRNIKPLPDDQFSQYRVGAALDRASYPEGTFGKAVDGKWYVVVDGAFRELNEDQALAYGFDAGDTVPIDALRNAKGEAWRTRALPYNEPAQVGYGSRQATTLSVVRKRVPTLVEQGAPHAAFLAVDFSVPQTVAVKTVVLEVRAYTEADADTDAGGLVQASRSGNARGNLSRVTILDEDGERLFTPVDLLTGVNQDGVQTVTLTGQGLLTPGQNHWTVVADIDHEVPQEQVFQVSWRLDKSFFVTGTKPLVIAKPKVLAGDKIMARGGLLRLGAGKGRSATVARGADAYRELNVFTFSNPREEPVAITSLRVTGFIDEMDGNADFAPATDQDDDAPTTVAAAVPLISLVNANDIDIGSTAMVSEDGVANFSHLSAFVVPARGTLALMVRASAGNSRVQEGNDRVAFDIVDPATDVSARLDNGANVEVKGALPNGGTKPRVVLTMVEHGTLAIRGGGVKGATASFGSTGADMYALSIVAGKEEDVEIRQVGFVLTDPAAAPLISQARLRFADEPNASGFVGQFRDGNMVFSNLNTVVAAGTTVPFILTVDIASNASGGTAAPIQWNFAPTYFESKGLDSEKVFNTESPGVTVKTSPSRAIQL